MGGGAAGGGDVSTQVSAVRVAQMVGIVDGNGIGVELDRSRVISLFEGLVSEPRKKTMQKAAAKMSVVLTRSLRVYTEPAGPTSSCLLLASSRLV